MFSEFTTLLHLEIPRGFSSRLNGAPLLVLKSITFAYDPREDRVLAVVNPGHPLTWSCWLTRRLVLSLLDNGGTFLASTSTLIQRAAPEAHAEVGKAGWLAPAVAAPTAPAEEEAAPKPARH